MVKPSFRRMMAAKKELIDFAFKNNIIRSFLDLGGVWNVDAAYTFYALDKYKPDFAFLVDGIITESVAQKKQKYPNLTIIQGSFGDNTTISRLKKVDAIFMFDILLHQVNPDWDEILEFYKPLTNYFLIFNQQFNASKTTRLLDLGMEGYFANVPANARNLPVYKKVFESMNEINPEQKKPWRDIHNIWQWGITNKDLINKVTSMGFELKYQKDAGQFGKLKNFRNYAFIFQKKK